jgi:hypothetical protein
MNAGAAHCKTGLENAHRTPAGKFSIGFIRGSGAKFSSMTRSTRSMASCSGARSTAQMSGGCSRSRVEVRSRRMRVRSQLYFRPRRQSARAQRISLPARSGVEGYGGIIESLGSERIQSLSRPESVRDPWRGRHGIGERGSAQAPRCTADGFVRAPVGRRRAQLARPAKGCDANHWST